MRIYISSKTPELVDQVNALVGARANLVINPVTWEVDIRYRKRSGVRNFLREIERRL